MPPALPFTFLVHDPGTPPRKVQLEAAKIRVGRIHTAQLRLLDTAVAFSHAAIEVGEDGTVLVRDIHTPNGTFVNGERVDRPRPLRSGDELRVGDTRIEVAFGADAARLAAVEAQGFVPPPPPPPPEAPAPLPEGPLPPREELAHIVERMAAQLAAAPPPRDPAEPPSVGEHLLAAWVRL